MANQGDTTDSPSGHNHTLVRFADYGMFEIQDGALLVAVSGARPLPVNGGCGPSPGPNNYCVHVNLGCDGGNIFC